MNYVWFKSLYHLLALPIVQVLFINHWWHEFLLKENHKTFLLKENHKTFLCPGPEVCEEKPIYWLICSVFIIILLPDRVLTVGYYSSNPFLANHQFHVLGFFTALDFFSVYATMGCIGIFFVRFFPSADPGIFQKHLREKCVGWFWN